MMKSKNNEKTIVYICKKVSDKCYALRWSYGEICVGCNCCGRFGEATRDKARLEYWKKRVEEEENFDTWMDDPKIRKIQEINRNKNLKKGKRAVSYYLKKLRGKRKEAA